MSALTASQWIRRLGGRVVGGIGQIFGRPPAPRHGLVLPTATYAPWNHDPEFLEIYRVARENTLVDELRCFELWQLLAQTAHLEGAIVEVGVWRGGTGAILARQAANLPGSPTVYLCDTFRGVVKAGREDASYRNGEHSDTSLALVTDLLHRRLGLGTVRLLEGIFPDQTAGLITESRVRFCHIDVDVYQSAADILAWVWPRMPVGGLVVYDDYGFPRCDGITRHVDEQRPLADRVVIHNLNGHAVVLKTAG
jgi:O-methyltransferase